MRDANTDSLQTDPSLLRRMGSPDNVEAWEEFVARYRGFIRGLASSHGLSEADAQDLEQWVLCGLVDGIVGFKPRPRKGSFRKWFAQRVRWRIRDMVRARQATHEEPLPDHEDDPESTLPGLVQEAVDHAESMDREGRVALVRRALASLPTRMSRRNIQAFEMVVLREESVARVAEVLHMTKASVYLACHRVEKALKVRLAKLLSMPGPG